MPPRFSVVLTTCNRENLLPRAIQSVLAQTESDWELLIVNDGDRDISQLVDQTVRGDGRVRLVQTGGRKGVSHARNRGIDNAQGTIVSFLDDDDEYLPGYLNAIGEAFLAQELDFTWTGISRIRTTSRGLLCSETLMWENSSAKGGSLNFILEIAASCGFAVRRSCLSQHGAFDESLQTSEDRDLMFRLIARGCRFAALPQALLRVHVQRSQGLSEWKYSTMRAAASARDDETVMRRYGDLVRADLPLRRSYLQRVARKYYRALRVRDYWVTVRALAQINGLSFKLVFRGMTILPRWFARLATAQLHKHG
jgi:glycosyltransferase involved in cell wall biosynthesis